MLLTVTGVGLIMQDFLRVGCLFPDTDELAYYTTAKMYLIGPLAVCVGLLAIYGLLRLVPRIIPISKNYPIFGDKETARQLCVNVLFLLLELTYTPIVLGATGLFMCKRLTDVGGAPTALYDAPHLDCKTDEWYRQLPVSLIVIVVDTKQIFSIAINHICYLHSAILQLLESQHVINDYNALRLECCKAEVTHNVSLRRSRRQERTAFERC